MSPATVVMPETFVFEHGGTRLHAEGVAERIVVAGGERRGARASDAVARALADRPPASVAVGALPFDDARPATLVVPERFVAAAVPAGDDVSVGEVRTTPVPSPAAYRRAVDQAKAAIARGDLEKVVLARMLVAQAEAPFDATTVLNRLREREPDAYVFAAQGFIGATPELLVSRRGDIVVSHPLAGTRRRGATRDEDAAARDALLASEKDRAEHAFVVDAIVEALRHVCIEIHADGPAPVRTGAMWHLGTRIEGRLRDPAPTSLELAGLLHPTPAVCGTPVAAARRFIDEHEGFDRTLYAGLVGWQDSQGDGEWAIVLRCAEVRGKIATLFAGAGIVAGSDADAELAETDAKLGVMLRALGAGGDGFSQR